MINGYNNQPVKRIAKIEIFKNPIYDFIDEATNKRVDATMDQSSDRTQNAVSSDQEDNNDLHLLQEYCDRRDSTLRMKLRFCLSSDTSEDELSFTNNYEDSISYIYNLAVDESINKGDIQVVGRKMEEYIKRGALLDWYIYENIEPTDSEMAIDNILDEIVNILRGRSWGRKPMQPFGPAGMFNYKEKIV